MSAGILPIGIMPGTVPDEPSLSAAPPAAPAPRPATLRGAQETAAAIETHLGRIDWALSRLVYLAEGSRRQFLTAGSVVGGGTIGTQAQGLLPPNGNRKGLSVQNTGGAGNLTIALGNTSVISGQGLVLAPGTSWDGRVSGELWTGSVAIIGSTSGVGYAWMEV